jgi:hypothetical protein
LYLRQFFFNGDYPYQFYQRAHSQEPTKKAVDYSKRFVVVLWTHGIYINEDG